MLVRIRRQRNPGLLLAGMRIGAAIVENRTEVPQTTKSRRTIWPSKSTPGICPKKTKTPIQKVICTPVFTALLFTVAKIWKQPKYPSMINGWIKKMWYINIYTWDIYTWYYIYVNVRYIYLKPTGLFIKLARWRLCCIFSDTKGMFLFFQHQLGVQQFNSILTLPRVSTDPTGQSRAQGSASEDCPHFRH